MLKNASPLMVAIALIGFCIPVLLAWSGLFVSLGAHPWWAVKTALIGAPIGAILALVPMRFAVRFVGAFVILAIALGVARYGKTQFAASYAEDAFAGQLWFFGWIGVALGAAMLATVILVASLSHRLK